MGGEGGSCVELLFASTVDTPGGRFSNFKRLVRQRFGPDSTITMSIYNESSGASTDICSHKRIFPRATGIKSNFWVAEISLPIAIAQ